MGGGFILMELHTEKHGRTLLVAVAGELDHHTSVTFKDELEKCLNTYAVKNIILDLKKLNFMDSSGIGVILGRYKQIRARGGSIGIFGMNPQVKRVFTLSGLNKIIKIYTEKSDALKTFEGVTQ
jgi:stage II sporulation protein AA (anti-sigma F factor antagonist)